MLCFCLKTVFVNNKPHRQTPKLELTLIIICSFFSGTCLFRVYCPLWTFDSVQCNDHLQSDNIRTNKKKNTSDVIGTRKPSSFINRIKGLSSKARNDQNNSLHNVLVHCNIACEYINHRLLLQSNNIGLLGPNGHQPCRWGSFQLSGF